MTYGPDNVTRVTEKLQIAGLLTADQMFCRGRTGYWLFDFATRNDPKDGWILLAAQKRDAIAALPR